MNAGSRPSLTLAEAKDLVSHLPPILDARTASETLGISDRTLRRWISAGRLRALRTTNHNGGRLRIARTALIDLLIAMAG